MKGDEELRDPDSGDTVNVDHVEFTIRAKQIGQRIRRLRVGQSMRLIELGRQTGLSVSFLSQIETGRVVPTLRNLACIAVIFGRDLSYFFDDEQSVTFRVSRQSERIRLQRNAKHGPTFLSENLAALILDGSVCPCIALFNEIDEDVCFRPRPFRGLEFTMILEGSLTLTSEQETLRLDAGDVVWSDGMRSRQYTCNRGDTARAFIITCNSVNALAAK